MKSRSMLEIEILFYDLFEENTSLDSKEKAHKFSEKLIQSIRDTTKIFIEDFKLR